MRAYVDSSVLIRRILSQPGALSEWSKIDGAVGSSLMRVECLRTIDRYRLMGSLSEAEDSRRRQSLEATLRSFELVEVTSAVLDRASEPLPVSLGSLDAIHLATALLWREDRGEELVFASHDTALASAARLFGFRVVGA